MRHLHAGEHAHALGLEGLHHLPEKVVPGVEDLVRQDHGEGLVVDEVRGTQHRMAETEGAVLLDVENIGQGLGPTRSEEHTSELQSHVNLVCRLLLEKKKIPEILDISKSSLLYDVTHT